MKYSKEVLVEALQLAAARINEYARIDNDNKIKCGGCPAKFICGTDESTGNCINDISFSLADKARTLNRGKKAILG